MRPSAEGNTASATLTVPYSATRRYQGKDGPSRDSAGMGAPFHQLRCRPGRAGRPRPLPAPATARRPLQPPPSGAATPPATQLPAVPGPPGRRTGPCTAPDSPPPPAAGASAAAWAARPRAARKRPSVYTPRPGPGAGSGRRCLPAMALGRGPGGAGAGRGARGGGGRAGRARRWRTGRWGRCSGGRAHRSPFERGARRVSGRPSVLSAVLPGAQGRRGCREPVREGPTRDRYFRTGGCSSMALWLNQPCVAG